MILDRKLDVTAGTFFSNLVMYFIILTTALTLHAHGVKDIETSKQAAEALRPLAGGFAATLYTVEIIGVGMLAIPTLTASAAYAFAEKLSSGCKASTSHSVAQRASMPCSFSPPWSASR